MESKTKQDILFSESEPSTLGSNDTMSTMLPPTTLTLTNTSILDSKTSETLYTLSRNPTTRQQGQKSSTVTFNRVTLPTPAGVHSQDGDGEGDQHIFYIAHPSDAKYQTDRPEYYITCVPPPGEIETVGNMHLLPSKSTFQKTEFTVLLSRGRSMESRPLFNNTAFGSGGGDGDGKGKGKDEILFKSRPSTFKKRYTWSDITGKDIAIEEQNGKEGVFTLDITTALTQSKRDALVALWILRLWYERAESREAKREEMDRWTLPVAPTDMKMGKRTGALGGFAAGGGGGC